MITLWILTWSLTCYLEDHPDNLPLAVRYHYSNKAISTFIIVNARWTMGQLKDEIAVPIKGDGEMARAIGISQSKVCWDRNSTYKFPECTFITETNLRSVLEFLKRKSNDVVEVKWNRPPC